MKVNWSDGAEFSIEVGQVWENLDEGILKIEKIDATATNRGEVTFQFEHLASPDTQPITGTDGFVDYLESCGFKLKA